jgi:hypothetical protein
MNNTKMAGRVFSMSVGVVTFKFSSFTDFTSYKKEYFSYGMFDE